MARLSAPDFSVLVFWGMVLSSSSAERQFFPQNTTNASWVDARRHCQVCFKDLATSTPEVIQNIGRDLSSEHWIGLRKRPVSASNNSYVFPFNDSTTFWSRWANGDPISFQNWSPGYPVFKSPYPRMQCCSCSCTCPARPTAPPMTHFSTQLMPTPTSRPTRPWTDSSIPDSTATNTTSQWSTLSVKNTTNQPTGTWTDSSLPNSTIANTTSQWSTLSVKNTTSQPTSTWTDSSLPNSTNANTTSQWSTVSSKNTTGPTPAARATSSITAAPFNQAPVESECVKKPMLFQDEPDLSENYIEDPCVAMLSFGTWVERECTALLPYICYEDRFCGKIKVTDIKATSASLSWEKGPGDVSHYRIEVNGSVQEENHSGLTYRLDNLTAGTFYSVQVFPVKCGRDLNPENGTFYTVPNKVTDLQVVKKTEACVSLNWTRPTGNVDLYIVETEELDEPKETDAAEVTVCGLTPGSRHNFNVFSAVDGRSQRSEGSSIDLLTKPATVSNVKTPSITDSSLVLSWDKPQGGATGYLVTTSWEGKQSSKYTNKTEENGGENKLSLENLPSATKITLSITAVAEGEEGEALTVVFITKPKDITELKLNSTEDTILAAWHFAKGSPLFTVALFLGDSEEVTKARINASTFEFSDLKSAANYTVTVYSVSGETKSSGVSQSIFTLPNPPRNPRLSSRSKHHLTFTWTPPINTTVASYLVTLSSSFWGEKKECTVKNKNTHTFQNLKSGTSYTFEVKTVAGQFLSVPGKLTSATDPDKREITVSMVCSSAQPLLCAEENTKDSATSVLKSRLQSWLGNQIFWSLEKIYTTNTKN